jgi:small GTP-binding protein
MLRRILNRNQDELLAENRRLLADLRQALTRFDASAEDQETIERSARQLEELFLLVVAGEFNAGKSAFINALLGSKVLEEGVTPTTTRVHIVKHGPAVGRTPLESNLDVITAPVELLQDINIVDTPGTNAIHREHEAITREFVPRSDMVLFVTSADRPFTESERAFLQGIRDWGKKIVVVVNKVDILETEADVARVLEFVSENARTLLGAEPQIFPVAARLALSRPARAAYVAGGGVGRRHDDRRHASEQHSPRDDPSRRRREGGADRGSDSDRRRTVGRRGP